MTPIRYILSVILLAALVISAPLRTYAIDFMPNTLSISDGLPQNTVKAILRDSKGFLWIGTNYGLARYDNSRMKLFYHSPQDSTTISHNQVESIFEDRQGRIWVMGFRGISVYDPMTERFTQIEYEGERITGRGHVILGEDIVISSKHSLLRVSGTDLAIERVNTTDSIADYIDQIFPWSPGCYICNTRKDGLWVFKPSLNILERLSFMPVAKRVESLAVDPEHNLWISLYGKGVDCYTEDGRKIAHFDTSNGLSDDIVLDILDTPDYIILAHEEGIDAIEKRTMAMSPNGLSGCAEVTGAVQCLYADAFGNMYAGTARNGVVMLQGVTMRTFKLNPTNTFEGPITSFLAGPGNEIYCGVDGAGIVTFDNVSDEVNHIPSTSKRKILSLANLDDRQILVCDYIYGLSVFDRQTRQLSPAPSPLDRVKRSIGKRPLGIHAIEISPGMLAICSDSVYIYNHHTRQIHCAAKEKSITSKAKIYPFYADSRRVMCFGENNVYTVDLKDRIQRIVCSAPKDVYVRAAQFNGRDTLYWATTDSVYVYRMGDTGSQAMNLGDKMRNIKSLLYDGKNLWIGANNRLFTIRNGRTINFEKGDGVIPNDFISTAVYAHGPYLYFGGNSGLVRVNREETDSIALNRNVKIDFSLAGLTVNGRSAMSSIRNASVDVPYDATIQIEIIDRDSNPSRSKMFRYYIEGTNLTAPFEIGERSISMNDLPAGKKVTLRVSCSLPDGTWSAPVHIITLNVSQVWWNSWWFRCILAVIGLLIILWGLRLLKRRRLTRDNRHRRRLLEHDVQVLANINESLRSPLNKVYQPLLDASVALEDIDSPEALEIADKVNSAIDMVEAMREIVDSPFGLLQSKNLAVNSMTLTARFNVWLSELIDHYIESHRVERNLRIDFHPDFDPGIITFEASRLEMIVTCVLADIFVENHDEADVAIELDDATGDILVKIQRLGESDFGDEATEAEVTENLRIIYARWLAEVAGITLHTWLNGSGELIKAVINLRIQKNGGTLHEAGDMNENEVYSVDLSDSNVLRDKTVCIVGLDPMLTHSLVNRHNKLIGKMKFAGLTADTESVIKMLKAEKPSMIVVDESESVKYANLLCRQIRITKDLELLPILLLTDAKLDTTAEREYQNEADVILAKPFDLNVFFKICQQLVMESSATL